MPSGTSERNAAGSRITGSLSLNHMPPAFGEIQPGACFRAVRGVGASFRSLGGFSPHLRPAGRRRGAWQEGRAGLPRSRGPLPVAWPLRSKEDHGAAIARPRHGEEKTRHPAGHPKANTTNRQASAEQSRPSFVVRRPTAGIVEYPYGPGGLKQGRALGLAIAGQKIALSRHARVARITCCAKA